MTRARVILLATALFLALSATAGLAAANLRSAVPEQLTAVSDQLGDASGRILEDARDQIQAVVPDLMPEAASDGGEPQGQGVAPDRVERTEPEILTIPGSGDDLLGKDGRLTVLVLGSDRREGVVGVRTDTMIVATLHPETGDVAMVSLPRDTVGVPIAKGRVYQDRINTLYWDFLQKSGKKTQAALRKTREALSYAFGTEIDYGALVEFRGLVNLVNEIGGVDVRLDESFVDRSMGKKGLRLRAGTRTLDGFSALSFSRSRKTTDDYDRSRRQQQVLAAIVDKVRDRGIEALPALVELVSEHVVTDAPLEAAPQLLEMARNASLTRTRSTVLEPGRFAIEGSVLYTIVPRIGEVRKMFDKSFGPVR